MRRVFQRLPPARRPAIMFERVKGHAMPLVAGILGASPDVYALALETTVDQIADKWSHAQSHPIPPVRVSTGPVKDVVLTGDQVDVTSRCPRPSPRVDRAALFSHRGRFSPRPRFLSRPDGPPTRILRPHPP
jgi:hypothetical protein